MHRLRAEDLAWQQVDGEIVCLDLRSSLYLSINQAGAAIWPQLAEGATNEELVASLVATFGIDEDRAKRDVDTFLDGLRSRHLLLES